MKYLKSKFVIAIFLLSLIALPFARTFFKTTAVVLADDQALKDRLTEAAYKKYVDMSELTYDEAITSYHRRLNTLFDKKIEQLLKMKPEDFTIDPPKEFPVCSEDGANLTAYCLGVLGGAEYQGFARAMRERLNYYKDVKECLADKAQAADNETLVGAVQQKTFENANEGASLRASIIFNEVQVAKRALDLSLAAYNELYWAWPLHQQYEVMIKSLEEYRDAFADFRTKVEHFPGTFIDATTTECS